MVCGKVTRTRVFLLFLGLSVKPDLIFVNYFWEHAVLRHSCFCKRRREEKIFSSPCRKFLHGMKRSGRADRVNFFAFAICKCKKGEGGKDVSSKRCGFDTICCRAYSSSKRLSHRYLRVSLTSTPERKSRQSRLGMAMRALKMSARFHTMSRLTTEPRYTVMRNTTR